MSYSTGYGNRSLTMGKGKYSKKKKWMRRRSQYRKYGMNRGVDYWITNRSPVPRMTQVTMRYCTAIQLDPGSAGIRAFHKFSAISIYDPDVTGTGHQPHGHDTYQLLYQHYKVIGSKLTATFSPAGAQAGSGTMVCAVAVDDSVTEPPSDIQNVIEGPDCVYAIASNADGSPNVVTLTKTFSPMKFLGITPDQWRSAGSALFGQNPNEDAYFNVFAAPLNQVVDADPVNVQIEISYIVQCSEPRNVAPS